MTHDLAAELLDHDPIALSSWKGLPSTRFTWAGADDITICHLTPIVGATAALILHRLCDLSRSGPVLITAADAIDTVAPGCGGEREDIVRGLARLATFGYAHLQTNPATIVVPARLSLPSWTGTHSSPRRLYLVSGSRGG